MTKYQKGDRVIVNDKDATHHHLEVGSEATISYVVESWLENGEQVYDVKGTSTIDGGETLQLVVESGLTSISETAPLTV